MEAAAVASRPGVKSLVVLFVLQTETPRAFWHIKLIVLNNWGNAGHTCIYRVQVHGKRAGTNDIGQGHV